MGEETAIKDTILTKAIEYVVNLKIKAVDTFLKEYVDPLVTLGDPEKLIGKPRDMWTAQDLQRLQFIYGQKQPNPLSNLLIDEEYERIKAMEAEL